jgi:preprotein translocase subunit SecD/SecD/SecF fusion protein
MLYFTRWATALILATIVAGFLVLVPSFFSKETVDSWPSWVPKRQVVLGLDLQGGSYLLYQIDSEDYIQRRLRTLVSDVRRAMNQEPRIGYTGLGQQGRAVQLRIRDANQIETARERLDALRNPLNANLLAGGSVYEFDLTMGNDGLARLAYSEEGLTQRIRGIVQTSIEVIGRRVDQLGTVEPSIQRQGQDRILVEAPGLGDPARLKALVGQTAQLTFHLVRQTIDPAQANQVRQPGTIVLPDADQPNQIAYLVDEAPLMTGEDLTDAQPAFDQRNNEPIVNFRL